MKPLPIFALASSLLAGCATQVAPTVLPVTHVETQVVEKAVPVACVTRIPQPRVPLSTSAQIYASGSGYQVVMRYDRELALRTSYENDLVAALTGCAKALPAPKSGSPVASGQPRQ